MERNTGSKAEIVADEITYMLAQMVRRLRSADVGHTVGHEPVNGRVHETRHAVGRTLRNPPPNSRHEQHK